MTVKAKSQPIRHFVSKFSVLGPPNNMMGIEAAPSLAAFLAGIVVFLKYLLSPIAVLVSRYSSIALTAFTARPFGMILSLLKLGGVAPVLILSSRVYCFLKAGAFLWVIPDCFHGRAFLAPFIWIRVVAFGRTKSSTLSGSTGPDGEGLSARFTNNLYRHLLASIGAPPSASAVCCLGRSGQWGCV